MENGISSHFPVSSFPVQYFQLESVNGFDGKAIVLDKFAARLMPEKHNRLASSDEALGRNGYNLVDADTLKQKLQYGRWKSNCFGLQRNRK